MAKTLPADPPFVGCRVYGPYEGGSRGTRRIVAIIRPDKTKTSMSYGRYLLCIKEARWLEAGEEADHVDDDRLNDHPGNLQVLTGQANRRKAAKGVTTVTLICPGCNREFDRERRQTHLVKGGTRTFCSRTCRSRVGALEGHATRGS